MGVTEITLVTEVTIPVTCGLRAPIGNRNADKLKEAGAIAYAKKSKLDLMNGGDNLVRVVKAALRKVKPQILRSAVTLVFALSKRMPFESPAEMVAATGGPHLGTARDRFHLIGRPPDELAT